MSSPIALLLEPAMTPFLAAFGVVLALVVLEVALLSVGVTSIGDVGADVGADASPDIVAEASAALDADTPDAEPASFLGAAGPMAWLGFGKTPALIWIAALLSGFALCGYAIQLIAAALFGAPVSAWFATPPALLLGLAIGGRISAFLGRVLPQVETSSVSRRRLAGRVGVVVTGVARRGAPAQARVVDRFGQTHYVRIEPFEDEDALAEGQEVAVLSGPRGEDVYRGIRLDEAKSLISDRS